ncbi:MAG: PrgI family mobile element protein [Candidatus Dormibacteria bacterium]
MQAEVPQPISAVPLRWGGFTGRQLAWLAAGAALPYILLRAHLGLAPALGLPAPWMGAALALAYGRHEGRQLDAWVGDWIRFQLGPRRLAHPGATRTLAGQIAPFVPVDGVDLAPVRRPWPETWPRC